jgi:L-rhamnose mutarotase
VGESKELYQKYCAYQSAWAQIQRLNKKHQWPYPQFLKTELINLFGCRGMWNSHTVKGMQDIAQFPDMQKWLERGKDELEPTDEDVWGIAKSQYTFVDLGLWKKQGTLKDTRRSLPSPMSSGGIRRIPSGMSESAGFRRNSVGWSLSHSGFQFHGHSNGIHRNLAEWSESGSLPERFPLESIGIPTRFHGIPMDSVGFRRNSNGFRECSDCTCYYNIKNNSMSKD